MYDYSTQTKIFGFWELKNGQSVCFGDAEQRHPRLEYLISLFLGQVLRLFHKQFIQFAASFFLDFVQFAA